MSSESSLYICCNEQFNDHEIASHLELAHDARWPQGNQQQTFYFEFGEWFEENFLWTIGQLHLVQHVRGPVAR